MAHFFHNSTRKYIISLLNLFSEIVTQKSDGRENLVPIYFASQDRLNRALSVQNTSNKGGINVPAMALELVNITYDTARKTNKLNKFQLDIKTDSDGNTNAINMYTPVPYNFDFSLSIKTRTISDMFQIIEQILPMFNPSVSINIKPFVGYTEDISIPITVNSVDVDFETDLEEDGLQRFITGNLVFTMKAWFYFPIRGSEKIIKTIRDNYGTDDINLEDRYILKDSV